MNYWKILIILITASHVYAQDTLRINADECQALFLRENLPLIAQHLHISQAEAMVQQAKLWNNPSFTFDQVNLWATPRQTNNQETTPPLWNNFGRDQQFAMEIEQLIFTAGKRKTLIEIEKLGVEEATAYFAELLRNLKVEFRNLIAQQVYFQRIENVYQRQIASMSTLVQAYQNQLEQGNVSVGEYVRLKALELNLLTELNELNTEKNAVQKELKSLMHIPASTVIAIEDNQHTLENVPLLNLQQLIEMAYENRKDIQLTAINEKIAQKWHNYQRKQRIPDLSLKAAYDRNGSTMLDFVGFGITLDLPVFNRNQGAIQMAQIETQIAQLHTTEARQRMENQVVEAYNNLRIAIDFKQNIDPNYEQTLDELLLSYIFNFQQRNIGMLEFIDFMEAYTENKRALLEADRNVQQRIEELIYAVGTEIR